MPIADDFGVPFGERLKQTREKNGKTPHEVAKLAGLSSPTYYDLENCAGDLTMTISLLELSRIASVLGVPSRGFFSDHNSTHFISAQELSDRIKTYLASSKETITEFEDKVGFVIEPALSNPSEVLNWNVDCLRSVCLKLGIDWLSALP